jgi:predicted nuclease of predicted toxin-antitoxin system
VKLKLDENLPHDLTDELGRRGHDVHTVVDERLTGEPDPVVVAAASDEGRMLLTLDRGIGDLRRYPPGSHSGIVVLRPATQDPDTIFALVERLVRAHSLEDLHGCVVVIEPQRIRIRRPEAQDPTRSR